MSFLKIKFFSIILFVLSLSSGIYAQTIAPRLPDTGQITSYTDTPGEDADVLINPMAFTDHGNGTITDNVTGLMWQKTDCGEMTIEKAGEFCKSLSLGGYNDWRLPSSHELFSINQYDTNPALNWEFFTITDAGYWWTSDYRADDNSRVWVVNSGGGIGPHPKTETISAGGLKRFHVRAVRNPKTTSFPTDHFKDNSNGTVTDNNTGLVWQQVQASDLMTWEDALLYANQLSLSGKTDWRLPNIKEIQSLNDEKLVRPSFNKKYFIGISSGNYWSSTTLKQPRPDKAWTINVDFGIVSYNVKTTLQNVICVRGGL
ncbi:MAG: DUF1566 domain-containing protein [Mariniphaga sp.]